jgi:hypothetical protein
VPSRPMAAPFLPVSAPAVIASRPKSVPIKKMAAETDATLAMATSSWNDRPMITSTATVTASRAACVAIAAAFCATMPVRRTGREASGLSVAGHE